MIEFTIIPKNNVREPIKFNNYDDCIKCIGNIKTDIILNVKCYYLNQNKPYSNKSIDINKDDIDFGLFILEEFLIYPLPDINNIIE